MKKRRRRNQPSLQGGRDPLFSCVLPSIRAAAHEIARQYDVSPSWVVATKLAQAFSISGQADYRAILKRKRSNGKT